MSASRLSLALDAGLFDLPDGPITIWGPGIQTDLSAFPKEQVALYSPWKPVVDAWSARGYRISAELPKRTQLSVVMLPRSKIEARGWIAAAAVRTAGQVVVDGQKTDGVDSHYRDLRKRAEVGAAFAKAHGKTFVIPPDASFPNWSAAAEPGRYVDDFQTVPGVFSYDRIDPGSALLAATLPAKLGARVADFGAGWGYLSRAILTRPDVGTLHLVEADHRALTCARANVTDPRARFHWADVSTFAPEDLFDTVITNPPFHSGRAADPGLGQTFLKAAALTLRPSGQLWLVANRHLPYETMLKETFRTVEEAAGDRAFKVLHARGPRKAG